MYYSQYGKSVWNKRFPSGHTMARNEGCNLAENQIGKRTFRPGKPVSITHWASIAGKKEGEGPLGSKFDRVCRDTKFGMHSWEQAEQQMQHLALETLMKKAGLSPAGPDLVFSGDLLNQCIGSSFTLRNTGIAHLGLYGACSTMAESLLLASMAVGGGYFDRVVAMTSSHFASSERQYRFPLGYGGQRTPTAQWTVTGSGAALVQAVQGPIAVESATVGTVTDLGITDANNMGAAMAPAAVILGPCPQTFQAAIFLTHHTPQISNYLQQNEIDSFSGLFCTQPALSARFPYPKRLIHPLFFVENRGLFASGGIYEPISGLFLRTANAAILVLSNSQDSVHRQSLRAPQH